jgi:hypothetical protein
MLPHRVNYKEKRIILAHDSGDKKVKRLHLVMAFLPGGDMAEDRECTCRCMSFSFSSYKATGIQPWRLHPDVLV